MNPCMADNDIWRMNYLIKLHTIVRYALMLIQCPFSSLAYYSFVWVVKPEIGAPWDIKRNW